jgi:hypothetical protein
MSIFDALEFLDFLDIFSWRLIVPSAIGIGAGLGIYYLSGKDPAGAAVAFALGFVGVCIGAVWQFSHGRRR